MGDQQPKKKKPYSKPQIFFEGFTLQTDIAASCDIQGNQADKNSCGYHEEEWYPGTGWVDETVFAWKPTCTMIKPGGAYSDDGKLICLSNFGDDWNGYALFGS